MPLILYYSYFENDLTDFKVVTGKIFLGSIWNLYR